MNGSPGFFVSVGKISTPLYCLCPLFYASGVNFVRPGASVGYSAD